MEYFFVYAQIPAKDPVLIYTGIMLLSCRPVEQAAVHINV